MELVGSNSWITILIRFSEKWTDRIQWKMLAKFLSMITWQQNYRTSSVQRVDLIATMQQSPYFKHQKTGIKSLRLLWMQDKPTRFLSYMVHEDHIKSIEKILDAVYARQQSERLKTNAMVPSSDHIPSALK